MIRAANTKKLKTLDLMHLIDLRGLFFHLMLVQLPTKESVKKGEAEGATRFKSSNEVQSVTTGVISGAI